MAWPYDDLIAKIFLPYFHKHGEEAIPYLVNGQISSRAFLSVYRTIDPIEQMGEKEKKKLKKSVIALFPEKNEEEMVKASKIIYTIGVVSQFVTQDE